MQEESKTDAASYRGLLIEGFNMIGQLNNRPQAL